MTSPLYPSTVTVSASIPSYMSVVYGCMAHACDSHGLKISDRLPHWRCPLKWGMFVFALRVTPSLAWFSVSVFQDNCDSNQCDGEADHAANYGVEYLRLQAKQCRCWLTLGVDSERFFYGFSVGRSVNCDLVSPRSVRVTCEGCGSGAYYGGL